jgi:hypothetical protein
MDPVDTDGVPGNSAHGLFGVGEPSDVDVRLLLDTSCIFKSKGGVYQQHDVAKT